MIITTLATSSNTCDKYTKNHQSDRSSNNGNSLNLLVAGGAAMPANRFPTQTLNKMRPNSLTAHFEKDERTHDCVEFTISGTTCLEYTITIRKDAANPKTIAPGSLTKLSLDPTAIKMTLSKMTVTITTSFSRDKSLEPIKSTKTITGSKAFDPVKSTLSVNLSRAITKDKQQCG
ncbi:hypothetical protein BGZ47_004340 [Haplosporangium gracile]|nr:hypothetical protein BGZ47_004340 [Haplosporangium gracile]